MINNNIEELIKNKALELGYESCGIIKVADMEGYAERLRENSELFPELKTIYSQRLYPYAFPQQSHEWAKSIVICISRYGKYKLPANNSGHIGKIYWFTMFDKNSKQNINRELFEAYLTDLGLKTFYNSFPGTTCYRWAAQKAGLGVIRKNNFFYTKPHSFRCAQGTNSNENGATPRFRDTIGLKGRQLQSTAGEVADCLLGLKPVY